MIVEQNGVISYRQIFPQITHHFFIIFPLPADFTSKTGVPLKTLPYAVIHNSIAKGNKKNRSQLHKQQIVERERDRSANVGFVLFYFYFWKKKEERKKKRRRENRRCRATTFDAIRPWRRGWPGGAWIDYPRGIPPGSLSGEAAPQRCWQRVAFASISLTPLHQMPPPLSNSNSFNSWAPPSTF